MYSLYLLGIVIVGQHIFKRIPLAVILCRNKNVTVWRMEHTASRVHDDISRRYTFLWWFVSSKQCKLRWFMPISLSCPLIWSPRNCRFLHFCTLQDRNVQERLTSKPCVTNWQNITCTPLAKYLSIPFSQLGCETWVAFMLTCSSSTKTISLPRCHHKPKLPHWNVFHMAILIWIGKRKPSCSPTRTF